ncbi:MAG: glycoside hydrolase family 3 N-terminal domain-containing protein, partial [Granulosicoccaceae bacterium]
MAHYHPARWIQPGPVVFDPRGVELQAHEREMLAHPAVGGVILFSHNFEERAQLRDLIAQCRESRGGELVVMVDQEGGRVQRFREGFSNLPQGAVYGEAYEHDKTRALAAAEDVAWLCAQELFDVGVDVNLAPVADLQTASRVIGKRAFHANPAVAAELTAAAVKGFQLAGVSATAK